MGCRREIIPARAVLQTDAERHTLSVEDTIWLYNHLTGLSWQEGMYAEYVPTHTLTLWNGEYRFEFTGDSDLRRAPCGCYYRCSGAQPAL